MPDSFSIVTASTAYQVLGYIRDSGSSFSVSKEPLYVVKYSAQFPNGTVLVKNTDWSYQNNTVTLTQQLQTGETVIATDNLNTVLQFDATQTGTIYIDTSKVSEQDRTKLVLAELVPPSSPNYFENVRVSVNDMYTGQASSHSLSIAPDVNNSPGTFSDTVQFGTMYPGYNAKFWIKQQVDYGQQLQTGVYDMLQIEYEPVEPVVQTMYMNAAGVYKFPAPAYAPNQLIFSCAEFPDGTVKDNSVWFSAFVFNIDRNFNRGHVYIYKRVSTPCVFRMVCIPMKPHRFYDLAQRTQTITYVSSSSYPVISNTVSFVLPTYVTPFSVFEASPVVYDTFVNVYINFGSYYTNYQMYSFTSQQQIPNCTQIISKIQAYQNMFSIVNSADMLLGMQQYYQYNGLQSVIGSSVLIKIGSNYVGDVYCNISGSLIKSHTALIKTDGSKIL